MSLLWLKLMYSVLSVLTGRPMPLAVRSRLCSKVSAWADVFARSPMSSAYIYIQKRICLAIYIYIYISSWGFLSTPFFSFLFFYVHMESSMMDVSNALPGPGPVRHAAQRPGSSLRSGNYCCSSIWVASVDENKNGHRKITMTHTQTTYINRIALRAGKKGACPAGVGALTSVFEKSATDLKQQTLQKCKQTYK